MKRLPAALSAFAIGAFALVPAIAPGTANAAQAATGDGWTATHHLTRDWTDLGGTARTDSRDVTVSVDKHTDLQARERIDVTWSGAHPSGGRAANPYGENGMQQEYPVVITECRGVDDPSQPTSQQLSPNTCWTSTWTQRTSRLPAFSAVWTKDKYADATDIGQLSGAPSLPADCTALPDTFDMHLTPFLAANGTSYSGCSSTTMPPEAAVGSADPPNEIEAFTGVDGSGSAQFEVRTDAENQSLGCSHTVACSLVVVPIEGISCTDTSFTCNQAGSFAPGSSNFAGDGIDLSVSPALWWSASNWRNRFSVPLQFALPPSTCQLLGSGQPVSFYGSALLGQAALQWAPAYCLDKKRFNWQANTMPDDAAFALMSNGGADAALVTGPRKADGTTKVGYAPTAVTGFGIAFDIDQPNNAGQQTTLKLNARLLAKLLTMSYPGSTMGQAHPGLSKNPISINLDPEFQELNPGLDTAHFTEAASTLLSLSTSSDVIKAITAYIAADPEAAAFMKGKADPYGMTINPSYKNLKLPVSTWPILDTWIPSTPGQACLANNPAPYLPKVAAPVSTFMQISTAMLLNWPNVQTVCDTDPATGLYKLGRIAPQGVGSRFMLGLVTLGDAARYGLPLASLQAATDSYVAPDNTGLAAAVKAASQKGGRLGAFTLDQKLVRRSSTIYPGMLVVSTAARLSGMDKAAAKRVSQFIDISATQGQAVGRGNGQLPAGYLPISKKGVTAKLYAADRRVSAAVLAQKPPTVAKPKAAAPAPATPPAAAPAVAPAVAPAAPAPVKAAAPVVSTPVTAQTDLVAKTAPTRSGAGGVLLPGLLFMGLVGGLVAALSRFLGRAAAGGGLR